MKVAIVDDSRFSRMQLKHKLFEIDPNLEIIEFSDGEEAVSGIPNSPVDLITLDMTMPKKDGLQTLIELRENDLETPIYMISANIQKSSHERCIDAGCTGFIQKPIETDALRIMFLE